MVRLRMLPEGVHKQLNQDYSTLFADMDFTLREMGVGDLGVGKRVRKMSEAFMGRLVAYTESLREDKAKCPWLWPETSGVLMTLMMRTGEWLNMFCSVETVCQRLVIMNCRLVRLIWSLCSRCMETNMAKPFKLTRVPALAIARGTLFTMILSE